MTAAVDFWAAIFRAALVAERKAGWDALRDRGPVVEIDGVYNLTRGVDVLAALRNPEVFSSAQRPRAWGFDVIGLPRIPTGLDPPEHSRYRAILQPLFSPQAVKELSPVLSREVAALVDAVAANGECDAMAAVAVPSAVAGLQMLCGLPPEDGAALSWWKYTFMTAPPDSGPYLAAVFEIFAYLARATSERRQNPSVAGLLSQLTSALSDSEAVAASFVVVGGGASNEAAAVGFALLVLATNPQLRAMLCADPGQVKVFVDEILRLEPPVSALGRVTTQDVTIGAVMIPAGAAVRLHVGAVNREDGDDISLIDGQITRHRHWSFGAGPHRCPAASFARMELTLVVEEWLRRIPDFELQPGYIPDTRDIAGGSFVLPSLPLRW